MSNQRRLTPSQILAKHEKLTSTEAEPTAKKRVTPARVSVTPRVSGRESTPRVSVEESTPRVSVEERTPRVSEQQDDDLSNVSVQDPEEIIADAQERIGEVPIELEKTVVLTPCLIVLPDNLVELLDEADLDENLRFELFGTPPPDIARMAAPKPATQNKGRRNPWYLDPKTWYADANKKREEYTDGDTEEALTAEDKANLHICDVYRRYCIKEGSRIPDCLM